MLLLFAARTGDFSLVLAVTGDTQYTGRQKSGWLCDSLIEAKVVGVRV